MAMTGDNDSTADGGSADESDEETGEYSRRNFMETAAAAGAVGAATGLAGCSDDGGDGGDGGGGDGGDGGGDGGDGGSDGTSEQDFLWWTMRGYIPAETQAIKDTASGFEDAADENVNLTTEVVTWDNVFDEWSASLEGRSMPNVSEMACEHAVDFGNRGAADPNTELFNQYDDWYETVSNWGEFDGEFWGMPWFLELRTSHVNMNLIEEAGHDSPPETWEEIVEIGQDVAEETDAAGWGTPGAQDFTTGHNISAFNYQSNGQWYDYEDGQFSVEADQANSLFAHLWALSLREQWDIAPGGWGGVDSTSLEELYREERVAAAHIPSDLARSLIDPQEGVVADNEDLANNTELTTMPAGPNGENHSFMGGSCMTKFKSDVSQHDADDLSYEFMNYMTQPEQIDQYFPVSAPNFLPVRSNQEESELFQDNPTELPDSWLDARLEQLPTVVRYGITGAERAAPFMGALEGSTTGYSTAFSGMVGNDEDPKEALRTMGNNIRSTINDADYIDYELEEQAEGPSLDDASDAVQPWIEGDGVPQIYNPYE